MFINLSNHPSSGWSEQQQQAAEQFGEVVDMPFPQVEPASTANEVHDLAGELVAAILEYGDAASLTVHVMGEMTFTFMVVTRLKELGIRCVASTTERKTTYNDDGSKVSEFSFVRFREY